jgi:hypothetical protein
MTDPARPGSAWERDPLTPRAARGGWERPRQQTVRLACGGCGHNLADVRLIFGGLSPRAEAALPPDTMAALHTFHPEPEPVFPIPRPGVRQAEHHHGGGRYTFRWDCRCGKTWELRSDRIDAIWRQHARPGRTARLILGHDAV